MENMSIIFLYSGETDSAFNLIIYWNSDMLLCGVSRMVLVYTTQFLIEFIGMIKSSTCLCWIFTKVRLNGCSCTDMRKQCL